MTVPAFLVREARTSDVNDLASVHVLGDRAAQLWVAEDNPRAHAFYRRNGFTPSGVRRIEAELNDLAEVRLVR